MKKAVRVYDIKLLTITKRVKFWVTTSQLMKDVTFNKVCAKLELIFQNMGPIAPKKITSFRFF